MGKKYKLLLAAMGIVFTTQAAAEIVFFSEPDFRGRSFTSNGTYPNLERQGFNDRASSAIVYGDRWEVCEDADFEGRCRILRPGRYPSLDALGVNDSISSVRRVSRDARFEERDYAPPAYPVYDARRRPDERTFEADVTSARAVYANDEQRCWVDREQVGDRGDPNIGGAVVGALIGGVLGHQVGSGRGNDLATAVGALAGGAVGANTNRGTNAQNVRRCSNVPTSGRPDYWDVTYNFRGQEHRVQMAERPGRTVTVNGRGEPRA